MIAGGGARSRASSAGHRRDIVSENIVAAVVSKPRASSAGRHPKELRFVRDDSNVPVYLKRVKNNIAEEQRHIQEMLGIGRSNDGVPPGHRLLSEDERREIIDGLQKRKSQLDACHQKLPLNIQTENQKQRARTLEQDFKEVEANIERFSRPRVLVAL